MQDTTINFLNVLCDKNIIYESDKTQIIHMYNNITEYTYNNLFSNDTKFYRLHFFSGKVDTDNFIEMQFDEEKLYTPQTLVSNNIYNGTIVADDKKTIFKTFIIDTEHIWKEQYCVMCLIEMYFTMKVNSILENNDTIISRKVQRHGMVNYTNGLIMFFFEIPYYDFSNISNNSNITINDAESIINVYLNTLNQNNIYSMSVQDELLKISNIPPDNSNEVIEFLHDAGIMVYNNKYIFVDFKHVYRSPTWCGYVYSLFTPTLRFIK